MLSKIIVVLLLTLSTTIVNAGMPGGYSTISVSDPKIQQIAAFAATNINNGRLMRVVSAASQVVAGINYKLKLEIKDASNNLHTYQVVVFDPLPSSDEPMQVTSVTELASDSH